MKAGIQVTPDSINTTRNAGYSANAPSAIRLSNCPSNPAVWFTLSWVMWVGQPPEVGACR